MYFKAHFYDYKKHNTNDQGRANRRTSKEGQHHS